MKNNQNHIHLFGNPEENFYVLGKRDKNSFSEVYNQISMLCARNSLMTKIIKTTTELSQLLLKKKENRNIQELKAYAEGLERPLDDVLFSLLLPEIVASFNKWVLKVQQLSFESYFRAAMPVKLSYGVFSWAGFVSIASTVIVLSLSSSTLFISAKAWG